MCGTALHLRFARVRVSTDARVLVTSKADMTLLLLSVVVDV